MPDPVHSDAPHDEAEELLPWYATGQLDEADRAKVESHLSSCGSCRRQLGMEIQLINEFQRLTPEIDTSWARLRAQIEPPAARPSRFAELSAEFWALFHRPAVAAFAAAQLAFLVIAGAVLVTMSRPAYHALGGTEVSASANVIVIFQPDAREREVAAALRASGSQLVGGPTEAGAYLLHVPAQRRAAAVAQLQADKHIQMAQPIDGTAE
jgi:anti-sigma factor RsiW